MKNDSICKTQITLDLSDHCIETGAKQAHQQLLNGYLEQPSPDAALIEKIAILQEFLQQTDFQQLRAVRPALSGGTRVSVALFRTDSEHVAFRVLDTPS